MLTSHWEFRIFFEALHTHLGLSPSPSLPEVIVHSNAHANVTLGVYHLLPDSTHTSWHVSCIPEAYLVHRSEGGKVENLDISIYISTFLTIMHTMHTLHTFLEKVCMMKVRESKKIKKFCGTKKIFISRVSPTATDSSGVCRYAGMHGGGKRQNKHIFSHHFSRHVFLTHISRKPCI